MNNLVLVRHGQSIWNKERRFTGWVDVDLTDQGVLEAVSAGKLIKELKIEFNLYFTSKLKRAIKTLEIYEASLPTAAFSASMIYQSFLTSFFLIKGVMIYGDKY